MSYRKQSEASDSSGKKATIPSFMHFPFLLFFVFHGLVLFILAKTYSLTSPTDQLDGAFQTASGLTRLSEGFSPGSNFLPYIGLGPLLCLYPVYWIFGQSLASSVLAAQFICMIVFTMMIITIARLSTHKKRQTNFWVLLCILIQLYLFIQHGLGKSFNLNGDDVPHFLAELSQPGASLRPVRQSAPYLMALLIYWAYQSGFKSRGAKYIPNIGAGLIGSLWSTDFAILTMIGSILLIEVLHVQKDCFSKTNTFKRGVVTFASFWVFGIVFCGFSGFIDLLIFQYRDISGDQYWYFAGWQNGHIHSLAQFVDVLRVENTLLGILLLIFLMLRIMKFKEYRSLNTINLTLGLELFFGGLFSTIGGHIGNYFSYFTFWSYILALSLIFNYFLIQLQKFTSF
jgi:hypothetical protein